MNIGIRIDSLFEGSFLGMHFESCNIGIDTSNGDTGFLAIVDSTAVNTKVVVNAASLDQSQSSLVIENLNVDSSTPAVCVALRGPRAWSETNRIQTVNIANKTVVEGSVASDQAWILGNIYHAGFDTNLTHSGNGTMYTVIRPASLLTSSGSYFVTPPPTYQDYSLSQIMNAKTVKGFPVAGDGVTDESDMSLHHTECAI